MVFSEDFFVKLRIDDTQLKNDFKKVTNSITASSSSSSGANVFGALDKGAMSNLASIKNLVSKGYLPLNEGIAQSKKIIDGMNLGLNTSAEVMKRQEHNLVRMAGGFKAMASDIVHATSKMLLWGAAATLIYMPIRAFTSLNEAGEKWVNTLEDIQALTNLSIEQTQKLAYITKSQGIDEQAVYKGIATLQSKLQTAGGRGKLMDILGISDPQELKRVMSDIPLLFDKLRESVAKGGNAGNWIKDLFGMKGFEFAKLFKMSQSDVDELMNKYKEFVGVVSQERFEHLDKMADQLKVNEALMSIMALTMREQWLPVLIALSEASITLMKNSGWALDISKIVYQSSLNSQVLKWQDEYKNKTDEMADAIKRFGLNSDEAKKKQKELLSIQKEMMAATNMADPNFPYNKKPLLKPSPDKDMPDIGTTSYAAAYVKQVRDETTEVDKFNKIIAKNTYFMSQNGLEFNNSYKQAQIYREQLLGLTEEYKKLDAQLQNFAKPNKFGNTTYQQALKDINAAKASKAALDLKNEDKTLSQQEKDANKVKIREAESMLAHALEQKEMVEHTNSEYIKMLGILSQINKELYGYDSSLMKIFDQVSAGKADFADIFSILGNKSGNSMLSNIGTRIGQTGDIGKGIGSAIGSVFGPIGSVVGSLFGGMIGGLFGPGKGPDTSAIEKENTDRINANTAALKVFEDALKNSSNALDDLPEQVASIQSNLDIATGKAGKLPTIDATSRKLDDFGDAITKVTYNNGKVAWEYDGTIVALTKSAKDANDAVTEWADKLAATNTWLARANASTATTGFNIAMGNTGGLSAAQYEKNQILAMMGPGGESSSWTTEYLRNMQIKLKELDATMADSKVTSFMDSFNQQLNIQSNLYDTTSEKVAFYNQLIADMGSSLDPAKLAEFNNEIQRLLSPSQTVTDQEGEIRHGAAALRHSLIAGGTMTPAEVEEKIRQYNIDAYKVLYEMVKDTNISQAILDGLQETVWTLEDATFTQNNEINNQFSGDIANNLDFDYFVRRIAQEMSRQGRSYAF